MMVCDYLIQFKFYVIFNTNRKHLTSSGIDFMRLLCFLQIENLSTYV